jgi:protein TonB
MLGEQRKGQDARAQTPPDRADFLGAAVPLRAQSEPSPRPDADLSNVIPFARRRKALALGEAPQVTADPAARPAPWLSGRRRDFIALFLLCSVGLHAGLYALFNRDAEPLASVGVQAISVEIVLGTNSNAGRSNTPSPNEVASAPSPEESKPEDIRPEAAREQPKPVKTEREAERILPEAVKTETVKAESAKTETARAATPDERPREAKAITPDARPTAEVKVAEATVTEIKTAEVKAETAAREVAPAYALPIEATAAPEAPEITADPEPAENAQPKPAEKSSEVAAADPAAEKPRAKAAERPTETVAEEAPAQRPKAAQPEKTAEAKEIPQPPKQTKEARKDAKSTRDRAAPASVASIDSNSIGRGRSDLSTNYRGLVAAQLARFKQYPDQARSRGEQGTAVISFTIAGDGRVTSSRLLRSSGHGALDDAAVATPRRASPFPPPPLRRAESFNIPIGYTIR